MYFRNGRRQNAAEPLAAGAGRYRRAGRSRPAIAVVASVIVVLASIGFVASSQAEASGKLIGATYVALGDSYSSGEGLGGFQAGTDNRSGSHQNTCHRSARHAYSDLSPRVVLPDVSDRAFWACSGATVADMEHVPGTDGTPAEYGQPMQVGTVGPSTKYITLTVGGDDLDFGNIGLACAEFQIHNHVRRFSSTSCKKQLEKSEGKIPALVTSLKSLYARLLNSSAVNSELVVAGYPKIFPSSYRGLGDVDGESFCTFDHVDGIGSVGMPVTDAKAVASFVRDLNSAIRGAVHSVESSYPGRVVYANVFPGSVTRNCKGTTEHATITGFELSPAGRGIGHGWKRFVSSATFHPTKDGQKVYAEAVESGFQAINRERHEIAFVSSPKTGAPPQNLGPYAMRPFGRSGAPAGDRVTTIASPLGTVKLSPSGVVDTVGDTWQTWSNGYEGQVYAFGTGGEATSVTLKFPAGTRAVYLYAEPDEFATYDMLASANNGTSSGDETVYGDSGASYFGFYARGHATLTSITISSSSDFAIGEFGISK